MTAFAASVSLGMPSCQPPAAGCPQLRQARGIFLEFQDEKYSPGESESEALRARLKENGLTLADDLRAFKTQTFYWAECKVDGFAASLCEKFLLEFSHLLESCDPDLQTRAAGA